ncbi:c-type cytochrome [Novosphingobium sp. 1949]|uniref:C-type cytochrome n=1 Tax=Novosphingobium organovorum TaxID=2930092 RepID=A0ABT0BCA8_9SPHN|nr:c-type cytochrome [Novosphingobium organovorum]MCJ2182657.1 c-type cytochrome [Novosphingobium organovorum]
MRYQPARSPRALIALAPLPLALALAACSGQDAPSAPETTASAAHESAAPAAQEAPLSSPSAPDSPLPEPSPTASATPIATPVPTATPVPPVVKAPAPPAPAKPEPKPEPVAAVQPPAAFARCAVCHNAAKGAPDKLGPNLYGVYGHTMGQGSFAFSDAVKNSGLTMDEATLDQWLENPRALIPGNRMSFPGLKNPEQRAAIIAYLKTLH